MGFENRIDVAQSATSLRLKHKIDEQAREQLNIYIEQMAKMQNVTEELKAYDPKCWVQAMNNIKENAEESVLREVVYQ